MGDSTLKAAVLVRDKGVKERVQAALEALGCEVSGDLAEGLDIVVGDSWSAAGAWPREAEQPGGVKLPYQVRLLSEDEPLSQALDAFCDDVVRYCQDPEELKQRLQARLRVVQQLRRLSDLEHNLCRAVDELRANEERFRTLVEGITDVFYITDGNGRLTYASPNLFAHTGYEPRELMGRSYLRLLAPEDRRLVAALYLAKTAEGAEHVACEFRARRKDGSRVWVDQRSTIVRDAHGNVVEYRNVVRDITSRKAMEEALRESEERFRSLYENLALGVYRTTPDGRILMANPALVHMLGYRSFEELTERNLEQEGFESSYPRSRFRERVEREGQVVGLESAWKRRDGSVIYVRESARAVRGESGRVLYYEGTAEDITERVTAERALRESEERYRLISQVISDCAYVIELKEDGSAVPMWGVGALWKEIAVPFRQLQEVAFPPDLPLWEQHRARLLSGEKSVLEARMVDAQGRVRWIREYATPVIDSIEGRVTRIVGAAQDITERRKLEEALQESEALFRTLTEAAPVAVAVIQDDRFVYANRFARELVEIPEDRDTTGLRFWELVDPEQREDVRRRAAEREAGRPVPSRYEVAIRTFKGKRIWLDLSVSIFEYRGRPARMAVAVDITEKKAVQAQFLHAQKMEAIGRLAGSVAHDFNNMLSVIMTQAELLKLKAGDQPGLAGAVGGILGGATRAAELTRKLLAFARKQESHPEVIDLNQQVDSTLKVLSRLMGENVELLWEPAADLWPASLDRSQVDQVVANLVINARDAVGGRGHIWVATGNRELTEEDCLRLPEAKAGRYVVLSVRDDGCGMDQEVLQRIFEPFFTTKGRARAQGWASPRCSVSSSSTGASSWWTASLAGAAGSTSTFRQLQVRLDPSERARRRFPPGRRRSSWWKISLRCWRPPGSC